MSKEYLEALNIIKFNPDDVDGLQYLEAFKVVESAIQRLIAIENSNPSEALEELKRIENNISYLLSDCDINEEVNMNFNSIIKHKSCDIIKQALLEAQETERLLDHESELNNHLILKAQEQEKVFDIIKKKDVDIQRLMKCINVATYNNGLPKNRQLTQEEFELLKRYWIERIRVNNCDSK